MQKKSHKKVFYALIPGMILLAGFIVSRIVPIIRGSHITLDTNFQGAEITQPDIVLSGTVSDTKKFSLNGTPIPLSPDGTFSQKVLLQPGYNMITFDTTDTLGKEKKESYALLLQETDTGTFALSSIPNQN